MEQKDDDKLKLESILGTSVSRTAGVQVPIDTELPIKLPFSTVHYELYKNHVELHIEGKSFKSLSDFLRTNLADNDRAEVQHRDFCSFAYVLKRHVEGWANIVELGEAFVELRKIVSPVLFAYCDHLCDEMEIAKTLAEYYESKKSCLPFHINIIDELHANENAHTRILTQLLKYKEEDKYLILSSFLGLIPKFDTETFDLSKASVFFNRDFIDGLVESSDFAVIIENKIHDADDQDAQIERYVKTEIQKGIPSESIWVIYLTSDGRKKITDKSLTKESKRILEDRFVELDYKHHILPWLRDVILPNCRIREEWLISAIKQYVDHLEGKFGMRESQKDLQAKVRARLASSIGCSDELSVGDTFIKLHSYQKMLSDLQNVTDNYIDHMVRPVVERFKSIISRILSDSCPDVEFSFHDAMNNGYFQIFIGGFSHAVHLEWIPLYRKTMFNENDYTLVLHVENKGLQKRFEEWLAKEDNTETAEAAHMKKYDSVTFYRQHFVSVRSLANMTTKEVEDFLKSALCDVDKIYSNLCRILK